VRRICAFSGKRGGFGAFLPLMRRIEADPELELVIMLADQHGSEEFGRTVDEARAAFPEAELELVETGTGRGDSELIRAENLAACLAGAARALARRDPEVVVVHGDRGEHLMAAFAALNLGMAVAHTQGGDRSGNVDEIQRHAISKLAHLHFPETEAAAERLRRMGEDEWRIHVVGSTYVDRIVAGLYVPPEEARRAVGLRPNEPFLLVLVHPETFKSRAENRVLASAVLDGARATGLRSVVTYPAADPQYDEVLGALAAVADDPAFVVRPNIANDVYLGLMAGAEALIGNSSAALVEAPYFRLPAVDVGDRQRGRERDPNVLAADAEPNAIAAAVDRARSQQLDFVPRLGDGRASERIVDVLKATERDAHLLQKELAY
jgi:GDP/UDP-N,N'-diacetylbacillosamine 2-epimerase (hydrolysing)